jgi:putative MATE family efflux protein
MGVSGAAVTNVISQSLGVAIGLWFLLTGRTRLRLNFRNLRFDGKMIWRIIKIGFPGSIGGVERTFGQTLLTGLIAPFGTVAVAAHIICQRIDMIIFMPSMALGNAAGVLAGQNVGAHQIERAEKSGWLGIGLVQAVLTVFSLVIFLWPQPIIRIFNSQPEMVATASTFLRIAVVSYLVMSLSSVIMSCINSVGDTIPPMLVSLMTIWVIQIPLAYFLPRITDLGVLGVRWAMVTSSVIGSLTYTIYFHLGRWKRKTV